MATPTARSAVAAVLAAALVALAFALPASSSAATSGTTVQEWLTTSDLTSVWVPITLSRALTWCVTWG